MAYNDYEYCVNTLTPEQIEEDNKRIEDWLRRKKEYKKQKQNQVKKSKYKNSPESAKRARLKKYGLSLDQYNLMLITQTNKFPICKIEFSGSIRPCVDHNHTTGQVRQLLCSKCNNGLGAFNENTSSLSKAIDYILKHN